MIKSKHGTALYVTAEPSWPSNSGGRLRAAAQITALRQQFDVIAMSATSPVSGEPEWDAAARRVANRRADWRLRAADIAVGTLLGDHTINRRAHAAGLARAFATVVSRHRPELVILSRPFFGSFISAASAGGAAVVIDADERLGPLLAGVIRNRGMPLPRRLRAVVELAALSRMERREYPRADAVWVATDREKAAFGRIVPLEKIAVIPNASPLPASPESCAERIAAIGYVGSYGHAPNEAAAIELIEHVMPAIRNAGGPQDLFLIGRDPTGPMRTAAAGDPRVQITGLVENPASWLCSAGVLVVPIRAAGGSRIKILEAAALGVPVVSTRVGAEGLNLVDGEDILLAETSEEFAISVLRLMNSSELRARIVAGAQRVVRASYSQVAVNSAVSGSVAELGRAATPD